MLNVFVLSVKKINNKSTHVEGRYEALVEKLKDKLCRVMFGKQVWYHIQVYGIRKETKDDCWLDTKMEYFNKHNFIFNVRI